MRKQYIYALAIFLAFVSYKIYMYDVSAIENCKQFFAFVFTAFDFSDKDQFVWNVILWILPQLPIILTLSDYFERTMKRNYSVLVYRHSSRGEIFLYALRGLIRHSVVFILTQFFITWVMGLFCRIPVWNIDIPGLFEIMDIVIYLMFVVVASNVFSLVADNIYVIILILFGLWLQLFLIRINIKWMDYLPVQGALQNPDGMNVFVSCGMVLAWCTGAALVGLHLFSRKKDFC